MAARFAKKTRQLSEELLHMKRILQIAFIVILLVVVLYDITKAMFGYDSATLQLWLHTSTFNNVKVGDNTGRVKSMFGNPSKRELNDSYVTWTYEIKSTQSSGISDDIRIWFNPNHQVTYVPTEQLNPRSTFSKIKPGMTDKQVERILGKPTHIKQSILYESWFYKHWNGPRHRIDFDSSGHVLHASISYEEFLGIKSLSCSDGHTVQYR